MRGVITSMFYATIVMFYFFFCASVWILAYVKAGEYISEKWYRSLPLILITLPFYALVKILVWSNALNYLVRLADRKTPEWLLGPSEMFEVYVEDETEDRE